MRPFPPDDQLYLEGGMPEPRQPQQLEMPESQPAQQAVQPGRKAFLRNLLTNFLGNLGESMSAAQYGPQAAIGAGILAPQMRAQRERQAALEEQRGRTEAARQQQMLAGAGLADERARLHETKVQGDLARIIAQNAESAARTTRAGAQVVTEGARAENLAAQTEGEKAKTARARFIPMANGIYEIGDDGKLEKIPGTSTSSEIDVTANMASRLNLPEDLVGKRLKASEINSMASATGRNVRIARTKEGVVAYDVATGNKELIGALPPPQAIGSYQPIVDDSGELKGFFNPTLGRMVGSPIEGGRKQGVAPGEQEKRAVLEGIVDDMTFLEELGKKHQNVIGPIVGRGVAAARNLVDVDPEINELFRISDNVADQLLRARSGAAITEKEYDRLRKFSPNPRGPSSKFFSDLAGFRYEAQRILAARQGEARMPPRRAGAPPPTKATARDPLGIR